MNSQKFIPYGRQTIDSKDIQEVVKTLKSDFLTQGPEIEKFEKALAKYTGARYCAVVNSGTAALHAAYFAVGLGKGDEFITSPMTFAATANAGLYLGAKPVFADIDAETGNIDPDKIEEKITKKTRAIVPINYAGQPVNFTKIKKIAKKHNLKVIDDACHALGATYKNQMIGNGKLSDISVLSFHPVKHITSGEGGAVLTNNQEYFQQVKQFLTHGITKNEKLYVNENQGLWYHEMQFLGFNYRLTDIQSSLGRSQLKKNSTFVKKRQKIAERYISAFKASNLIQTTKLLADATHAYHLFPIKINNNLYKYKKEIFEELHSKKIGVQVHYIPVYWHPYYQELGYKRSLCPNAEDFYQAEISLPMYPTLELADQKYVISTLFQVLEKWSAQ